MEYLVSGILRSLRSQIMHGQEMKPTRK